MTNTYAIGDSHGCRDQLARLFELCEREAGQQRSKFILLGDYIDRGPDSRGVIEFLLDMQKWSPDEIICLKGNHEDLFLAALDGEDAEMNWLANGGGATLRSYRASRARDIPTSHIDWIRSLPLSHDDGQRFFVHAGVHPDRPLDQQRARDLLWIREPFLSSNKDFGRLIVHGHTPLKSGIPDLRPNRLNLDTGAVYGRALTSAVFSRQKVDPVKFLTTSSLEPR
ncbi:metallophosphoesterase family protein [Bradyrhizobium sp. JYMT SZCCT0428]|uniref:metallophosphoesterase family protein n=1 Tax=Bradyrhizobium sp. JYMT SZCCT0428 TaxID=2807673 RepID=UPI001BADA3C5|nr:metallophosphoesterase family protein [Bradyrhizobium sp. JYMT SZCCT0428]MBR1154299.1 serine/threonine protein phosphatase [Bradyrhizobium sp. JYMT SZCCT0428]